MRTRSNHKNVAEVERAYWEAHRNAEAFRWTIARLMDARRAARERLLKTASSQDRAYIFGVASTLWTMTWSKLQWRLGNADRSLTFFNYRTACEGLKCPPTHGGFHWPSGELADVWAKLGPDGDSDRAEALINATPAVC